ncbi:MAG: hypothetical protein ACTSRK_07760 [Promethearchaeota archaeon]
MTKSSRKAKTILILILIPIILAIFGGRYLINSRPQQLEFEVGQNSVLCTVTEYKQAKYNLPVGYDLGYSVDGSTVVIQLNNTEATAYKYRFVIEIGVSTYNVTFFSGGSLIHSEHTEIQLGNSIILHENPLISGDYNITAEITVS